MKGGVGLGECWGVAVGWQLPVKRDALAKTLHMSDHRLELDGRCRVTVASRVVAKENHCSLNQHRGKGLHPGGPSVYKPEGRHTADPAPHAP